MAEGWYRAIGGDATRQDVIDTLEQFNESRMGKGIVVCNDTPGFLGNRVGVYAIQKALHTAFRMGLTPEEADAIFVQIDCVRKSGSIVSSNTSTIPISLLVEDMPMSFRAEFAITHFFNPVRFMRLLEIVRGTT